MAGLVRNTLRLKIWAERKARGWPAQKMAEMLRNAVSDPDSLPPVYALLRMVRGWEAGRRTLTETYRLLYSKVFEMSEDDLFGASSVYQSEFPRDYSAIDTRQDQGSAEDAVDVLSRVQKLHRSTVHPEIIGQLQDNLQHTVTQYERFEHASLVPALLKQRVWIDAVLAECSQPRQRQQLFEIAGATSGVLGYVAVGRGDFPLARAYCLEAFQLGDFAENPDLQAWVRGMQSFCEYYAGRYDEALRLAELGRFHPPQGYVRLGQHPELLAVCEKAAADSPVREMTVHHR